MSGLHSRLTVELLLQLTGKKTLQDITGLSLSAIGLEELDGDILKKLVKLESLDVSRNKLLSFPSDVSLPFLKVLDCSENGLESLTFVKNFQKLQELYAEGNKIEDISDVLITRTYCPELIKFDLYKKPYYTNVSKKYKETIIKEICSTWETEYGGKYEINGIYDNQFHELLTAFTNKVKHAAPFLSLCKVDANLIKYANFLADKMCLKLMEFVQSGLYKNECLKGGKIHNLLLDTSNSRRPSRHSSLKADSSSVILKRKVSSDDITIPKKVAKCEKKNKNCFKNKVEFNIYKEAVDTRKLDSPPLSDYDPQYFLRCHSTDNNPRDEKTEIWSCEFEPNPNKEGETTNIVATCGGGIVSLIDCQTGKVMRRYKDPDEKFYALSWTVLSIKDGNRKMKTNILATGGYKCDIVLIHPSQLVMYARIPAHKERINCLLFHPSHSTYLFSASLDERIILWDIGIPNLEDYTTPYRKLLTLVTKTEPLNIAFSVISNSLVVGCEDLCLVWKLDNLKETSKQRGPDFAVCPPTEEEDGEPSLDGMKMLTNNLIATKCRGDANLFVWNVDTCFSSKNDKDGKTNMNNFAVLEHTESTSLYINIGSSSSGLLAIGDDNGNIYLYNTEQLKKKKYLGCNKLYRPSQVLHWPEIRSACSMISSQENDPIEMNCLAVSSDNRFIVCGTSKNLVCIWEKSW